MSEKTFTVNAVGYVHTGEDGFYLEIEPEYAAALKGLEGFGYIDVLWWCHLYDEYREIVETEKPYTQGPETMGIFATRSPVRPNPIALTPVAVLKIDHEQGRVYIPFIDAEDGTPILDIKPYHPCTDRVKDAPVPEWCAHWPAWYEDNATFDWEAEFENAQ